MEPTAIFAARHAVTRQQCAGERQAEKQDKQNRWRVHLGRHSSRRGDVDHFVERGKKKLACVGMSIRCSRSGDCLLPDFLLHHIGLGELRFRRDDIWKLLISCQATIDITPKFIPHTRLRAGPAVDGVANRLSLWRWSVRRSTDAAHRAVTSLRKNECADQPKQTKNGAINHAETRARSTRIARDL